MGLSGKLHSPACCGLLLEAGWPQLPVTGTEKADGTVRVRTVPSALSTDRNSFFLKLAATRVMSRRVAVPWVTKLSRTVLALVNGDYLPTISGPVRGCLYVCSLTVVVRVPVTWNMFFSTSIVRRKPPGLVTLVACVLPVCTRFEFDRASW